MSFLFNYLRAHKVQSHNNRSTTRQRNRQLFWTGHRTSLSSHISQCWPSLTTTL